MPAKSSAFVSFDNTITPATGNATYNACLGKGIRPRSFDFHGRSDFAMQLASREVEMNEVDREYFNAALRGMLDDPSDFVATRKSATGDPEDPATWNPQSIGVQVLLAAYLQYTSKATA